MHPLVFSMHAQPFYTIAFAIALAIWYIPERIGSFWLCSSRDPTARRQDRGSLFVIVGSILTLPRLKAGDARDRRGMALEVERTPALPDLLYALGLPGLNRSG
ncbi:MAG TPA: hypothetical protein VGS80_02855 [Ktedonobacterales bacterium]|nr:hypothetical protein [Ktedonobacterales bacterium]